MVSQQIQFISDNEDQLSEGFSDEQELTVSRRFSRDATAHLEKASVMSKFNWGDAISGNSARLMLTIQGAPTPQLLQFENELILGRKTDPRQEQKMFDLTPFGGSEKGVSRIHAALQRMRGNLFIVDLGSTNKTYLNGQRLASNELHILMKGDEIRLGNLVVTINNTPADYR